MRGGKRSGAGSHSLLLAESSLWRAVPHVFVPRMPPPGARSVCSVRDPPHLVFLLLQMCWHDLSVHYGASVGLLGASCREVARSARMGSERHYADQAARYAGKNVPANLGDAGVPRGGAQAGGLEGEVNLGLSRKLTFERGC
jgi:hypothetical protein